MYVQERTATDLAEKLQRNLDSKEASLATAIRDAQNATNEKVNILLMASHCNTYKENFLMIFLF